MNEQPPESITNMLDMTFNKIPAGTFMMGSPEDETVRLNNEQQHPVTISKAFYMQTTEVTQGQWKAVMGTEPCHPHRDPEQDQRALSERWKEDDFVKEGPNYPATYVSWNDAVAYCKKLSEKEGKTYRLPTEAEWEYACRAGTETAWSFGDDEKELGDYAWYYGNTWDIGERYAHQVGLKKPNPFGLYDMHGNVYEWCHDYYGDYKQYSEQDPTGPAFGSKEDWSINVIRVLRGGSWVEGERESRSACRYDSTTLTDYACGFRLVRELD